MRLYNHDNDRSELRTRYAQAHQRPLTRLELISIEMQGLRSRYEVAKANGDAAWMQELIERSGELQAEKQTIIDLADEAAGVYEEGE